MRNEAGQLAAERELEALKKTFPEIKADSVFGLGQEYINLRVAGVGAEAAYVAAKGAAAATAKPAPPSMGALSKDAPDKEYYTNEELDTLTDEQLDKPGVLERALKSMARLKPA
jgi:hypothetical protein